VKAILKSVSRSFYLTIKFLPRPLRDPISLAYLLARATDTVADTPRIAVEVRLTNLLSLGRVIAGELDLAAIAEALRNFAAQQSDPAERKLIENLPACITWLEKLNPADRADVRAVLQTIVKGQELDLRRFGDPATAVPLQDAAELDEYTYLVAGCVGEFWTGLGFRRLPPFARRSSNEMKNLGIDYGKGLQLINILRDRSADEKNGRFYFPESADINNWIDRAESQTRAGIDYACSLTNWRTRFATALPALIGARTIALLRAASLEAGARTMKVPRSEVRGILFDAAVATTSPSKLRALFDRLLEVRLPA
jgi:farnesyl-diphosphate farnesyltransferase